MIGQKIRLLRAKYDIDLLTKHFDTEEIVGPVTKAVASCHCVAVVEFVMVLASEVAVGIIQTLIVALRI